MDPVSLNGPLEVLPGGVDTGIHRHYHVVNCFRYGILSLECVLIYVYNDTGIHRHYHVVNCFRYGFFSLRVY